MRSERVSTHLTCNQACTYCDVRSAALDRARDGTRAVVERIDAALRRGAGEIVISGGEPGMRRDLVALVRRASASGARRVGLETNATLLTRGVADALRAAGLSWARVNLAAWGDACDALTRDPGGFARTLEGMRALTSAMVPLEVSAVVVRGTLAGLAELPRRIRAEPALDVTAMVVAVPVRGPRVGDLVSYEEAAPVLHALAAAARAVRLPLELAAGSGPPPCMLEQTLHVARMVNLRPGGDASGFVRLDACGECLVRDRCSGPHAEYVERFGRPSPRPVTNDRVRRALVTQPRVDELVAAELVRPNRSLSRRTGKPVDEALVRVNYRCNQQCRFCFVPTHLPQPPYALVSAAILRAATEGKQITLTGGEPTLHPRLGELVRLAKSASPLPVGLQTNAVRLTDASILDELLEAGLDMVQVSLHASSADRSDAMTGAPGTFSRTVRGIDALHAAGLDLALNFVITRDNNEEMLSFVRLVAGRWPRANVGFAFVAPSSDLVPRDTSLIPRYTEVLPRLLTAVEEAERLGLRIGGFESMCGLPLCLLPERLRARVAEIPAEYSSSEFIRPAPCQTCGLSAKCYGVRRSYVELYGTEELGLNSSQPNRSM